MANGFELMAQHFASKVGLDLTTLPAKVQEFQDGLKHLVQHFDGKLTAQTTTLNEMSDRLEKLEAAQTTALNEMSDRLEKLEALVQLIADALDVRTRN